jgi:NAD(P)H-flavin reductase
MLNYDFIFPPPEQLEVRRQRLHAAGFQAWATPILILLAITLFRVSLRIIFPEPSDIAALKPRSKKSFARPPSPLTAPIHKAQWILNTTFIPEFGPLHVQLSGAIYASYLLYLAFRDTDNDYMHLTKQFGHIAISQLPWQYLLAFKSPRSPITLATGLTHERLNAFHRLFGRVVHALLACHAVLYLNFFVKMGNLEKRIKDRDVRLGVVAFWMFNVLGILAISPIRKKVYHVLFYRSHVFLTAAALGVLWFHQPWTKWYVGQAAVFWVLNGWMRTRSSNLAVVESQKLAGEDLMKVKLQVGRQSEVREQWVPGQHVYLTSAVLGPRNPYTVVDVQKKERGACEVTLVVRRLGGPGTKRLAESTAQNEYHNGRPVDSEPQKMNIEGPYGEASEYLPTLIREGRDAGQILLVGGGVGATYTLPIYLSLLKARLDTDGVKMVWFVKSADDARWGIEMLLRQTHYAKNVDIYVTQPSESKLVDDLKMGGVTLHYTGKRPELATVVESVMTPKSESNTKRDPRKIKKSYEPVTVLVCGPPGLSQALRSEVGKHVLSYGRDVRWFEEQFGFGGSW